MEETRMSGPSGRPAPRVLLVDDNEAILEFMSEVFTTWGPYELNPCEVHTASGVQEAIGTLSKEVFDLVILDMVMGDGNGLQVLEALRQQGTETPVIIVSADDPPDLQKKAIEMGARSFLRKGDGIESLVRNTLTILGTAPSGVPEDIHDTELVERRDEELGTGRILIIDDDPLVSDALASMIRLLEDVDVKMASGGKPGLEIAGEWQPHVILLDIAMPDLDGRQTLKALLNAGIKARVIMVSAFRDSDIAQECIRLGAVDYVPKPVDFPFLKRAVAGHLALAKREAVT